MEPHADRIDTDPAPSEEPSAPLAAPDDASAPWAMQLAARVEKRETPTRVEICAAAAVAVVEFVADDRATGGPWRSPVDDWQQTGRIRKLVRRARGSAWDRAELVEGVTATVGRAQVRAFVPCPMNAVPDPVRKLQIQSSPLPSESHAAEADADTGAAVEEGSDGQGARLIAEPGDAMQFPAPAASPRALDDASAASPDGIVAPASLVVLEIAVTPEVEMTWGKAAAQCAHAAQVLWRESSAHEQAAWRAAGRGVRILHPPSDAWPAVVERATIDIRDGGYTEIPAGTRTTVARWAAVLTNEAVAGAAEDKAEGRRRQG